MASGSDMVRTLLPADDLERPASAAPTRRAEAARLLLCSPGEDCSSMFERCCGWRIEQVPLAAKQRLGAARQFVHAPEACQRLPEVSLPAGMIVSYVAATLPAVPTAFWDRQPRPTPGRLRRALTCWRFPQAFSFPARLREKRSCTAHLPKAWW